MPLGVPIRLPYFDCSYSAEEIMHKSAGFELELLLAEVKKHKILALP
jgi:hypothetical protein